MAQNGGAQGGTLRAEDPVNQARRLAGTLSGQALRHEQQRSLSAEPAAALREAGLFALLAPRSAGGLEAAPHTTVAVIEELTRADAAAGWTVLAGQGAVYLAWLDAAAAQQVVARRPQPLIIGASAPPAQGEPAGGDGSTLRISGRWSHSSGCTLADYLFGAFHTGGARSGGPRIRAETDQGSPPTPQGGGEAPSLRLALLAADQVDIHDTGWAAGLRGAGSHDVVAREVEVPAELTVDPAAPPREPGPLYRLPHQTLLMVALAGFPLGAARRVLDEYAEVAGSKRNLERALLAETPLVQQDRARGESALRAARAGVFETLDTVWQEASRGDEPGERSRALFAGAVQHAMRTALEIADTALRACGASQLYQRAPLQRYFRDLQAAAQHPLLSLAAERRVGAVLFGQDVPAPAGTVERNG